MTEHRGAAGAACERGIDAVALAQGELSAAERAAMERHLVGCSSCRELAAETRVLLEQLGPRGTVAAGRRAPRLSLRLLATAAAVAAVLVVGAMRRAASSGERPGPTGPAIAQQLPSPVGNPVGNPVVTPVKWVESNLAPDGTWYASTRTGPRAREPGLHAFGLLALVRGTEAQASAGRLDAIRDAAAWLMAQQADDGSIGMPLASGHFDHPVATLALVEAAQITEDQDIRSAAERALGHIVAQRAVLWRAGGQRGHAAWTLAALSRAGHMGYAGLDEVIRQGRAVLGPAVSERLDGDTLSRPSFWELALGNATPQPRPEPAEDLFSVSLAVLAPTSR